MDNFYRQYNGIDIKLEKVSKSNGRFSKKFTFSYLWLRFIIQASDEDTAFQAAYNFLIRERM